jgi:hypothetical protein
MANRDYIRYKDYKIYREYYPFERWTFVHDSYDGAPDAGDHRCGNEKTVDDCIEQIDEIEDNP